MKKMPQHFHFIGINYMNVTMTIFLTMVLEGTPMKAVEIYPRQFEKFEQCQELKEDEEFRHLTYRYLSGAHDAEIVDMKIMCMGDLSTTARNNR